MKHRRPTLEEVLRDAWNDLLEKDDRTSPEDTPEMVLITFEELCEFMCRANGATLNAEERGNG